MRFTVKRISWRDGFCQQTGNRTSAAKRRLLSKYGIC